MVVADTESILETDEDHRLVLTSINANLTSCDLFHFFLQSVSQYLPQNLVFN